MIHFQRAKLSIVAWNFFWINADLTNPSKIQSIPINRIEIKQSSPLAFVTSFPRGDNFDIVNHHVEREESLSSARRWQTTKPLIQLVFPSTEMKHVDFFLCLFYYYMWASAQQGRFPSCCWCIAFPWPRNKHLTLAVPGRPLGSLDRPLDSQQFQEEKFYLPESFEVALCHRREHCVRPRQ